MADCSDTRFASHAGTWYNSKANALASQLSSFVDALDISLLPKQPGTPKAIICPHAGYRYCGYTAAYSWSRIIECTTDLKQLIILGPSHHLNLRGCALPHPDLVHYATPFGKFDLDIPSLEKLRQTGYFSTLSKSDDEAEHSIEMQLPALYFLLTQKSRHSDSCKMARIIPIVVGGLSHNSTIKVAEILQPYFRDPDTFFVISSDFCHWGSRFRFKSLPNSLPQDTSNDINTKIKVLDGIATNIIVAHNKKGFWEYMKETKNTICGENPIKILLELIDGIGFRLKSYKLHYSQSSIIKDPHQDVCVSYCSIVTYNIPLN